MADRRVAYWHTIPGVCDHPAFRVGGECNRPDEGEWTPLVPAGETPSAGDPGDRKDTP